MEIDWIRVLDIAGLTLGLLYLLLEYKASIWLWLVNILMVLDHGYLYFTKGLYADFGMQFYYLAVTVYGFVVWRFGGKSDTGEKKEKPITHFPRKAVLPALIAFAAAWTGIYLILVNFTDSTVPILDSFTTSLSMIAMWALAQKWVEQWLLWLVVDGVCTGLYIYKGIPFSASLYGFYTVVAVLGYFKWRKMAGKEE